MQSNPQRGKCQESATTHMGNSRQERDRFETETQPEDPSNIMVTRSAKSQIYQQASAERHEPHRHYYSIKQGGEVQEQRLRVALAA